MWNFRSVTNLTHRMFAPAYVQSFGAITKIMVKTPNLVQISLISYRSKTELGAFWNFRIFGRNFNIPISHIGFRSYRQKLLKTHSSSLIYLRNISWKEFKKLNQNEIWIKWIGEILAKLWRFKVDKNSSKCWLSSFEVSFGLNISAKIDPINVDTRPFLISFMIF